MNAITYQMKINEIDYFRLPITGYATWLKPGGEHLDPGHTHRPEKSALYMCTGAACVGVSWREQNSRTSSKYCSALRKNEVFPFSLAPPTVARSVCVRKNWKESDAYPGYYSFPLASIESGSSLTMCPFKKLWWNLLNPFKFHIFSSMQVLRKAYRIDSQRVRVPWLEANEAFPFNI